MAVQHVGVTLDCVDLDLTSRFWMNALGFEEIGREGDYILLGAPETISGLRGFTLQRVPEDKTVKNRMHFDVVVDQVPGEVDRMVELGATVIAREAEPTPYETVVMADPAGNEFCVIRAVSHD